MRPAGPWTRTTPALPERRGSRRSSSMSARIRGGGQSNAAGQALVGSRRLLLFALFPDPEHLAPLGRDALRRPLRLPDDVHVGGLDPLHGVAAALDDLGDGARLWAGLRGQGHGDVAAVAVDLDVVDEPEVHDVDR